MNIRIRKAGALLAVFIFVAIQAPANAWDWTAKGGGADHNAFVDLNTGFFSPEHKWRIDQLAAGVGWGSSATQPVVAGEFIYHLAGDYLWRIPFGYPESGAIERAGKPIPKVVTESGKPIYSTPTYSPDSKVLYFGTPQGTLYRYHTERNVFLPTIPISGCPIVASPLVFHRDNEDLVVVLDKACGETGGHIYLYSFGDRGQVLLRHALDVFEGAWLTPSPVPRRGGDKMAFLVGADGANHLKYPDCSGTGIAWLIEIGSGYKLDTSGSPTCSPAGFAGTFVSKDDIAYWVDVNGTIRAWHMGLKAPPDGWNHAGIDLAKLIDPAGAAFTNTEPAIDKATGAIYVTLRNFTTEPGRLRGCPPYPPFRQGCEEPGAPGAIVALNPDGSKKWAARLSPDTDIPPHLDKSPRHSPAVNTSPLLLKSLNVAVFGDVNGNVYAYRLDGPDMGRRVPLAVGAGCAGQDSIALIPGERPRRGPYTYSQEAGVGSDPMVATGPDGPMILMGANTESSSRLVALRAGRSYNLRWATPAESQGWGHPSGLTPVLPWPVGTTAGVAGSVVLEYPDPAKRLQDLHPDGVSVRWYVTDKASLAGTADGKAPYLRPLGQSAAPGTLKPAAGAPLAQSFKVDARDPEEGYIIGVIDLETRMNSKLGADRLASAIGTKAGLTPHCPEAIREVAEGEAPATFGEAASLQLGDNYLVLPYKRTKARAACGNLRPELSIPAETPKSGFEVAVIIRREGCEELKSVTAALDINGWKRRGQAAFSGDTARIPFQTGYLDAGSQLNLTAEADDLKAVAESDESDNLVRGFVQIGTAQGSRCPGNVAPHNCFQTRVQSEATHYLNR